MRHGTDSTIFGLSVFLSFGNAVSGIKAVTFLPQVAEGSSTTSAQHPYPLSLLFPPICSIMLLSTSVSFSDLEAFCGRLAARCYRLLAIRLQNIFIHLHMDL